jgi:hypothetical protein
MTSSAITGNTSGIATATTPGLYKAGQAPGSTAGTAIASGYVGERQTQTQASNVTLVGSSSVATTSKELQPGVYLLAGTISINVSANGGAINCSFAGQTKSVFNLGGVVATTGNARLSFIVPVSISSATSYSFSIFCSSTVTGAISGTDQDTTWTAIRIA